MPITLTSRYKPLTYDEITRPLIEQTQAQAALEEAYMNAQDQVAQLQAQANEQTDPIAYARLNSYANSLQQQADSLMRQGLNRNSRTALLNMRRRYGQDILPIQNAVTRRNELMEERRKLRLTHPDMLQEREVIGLDDLLQNPTMGLGSAIYGSDISKRAAAITAAIGKGRQSIALGQNLDKYTQTILSQSGLSTSEIQAALAGDDSVLDKALSNLYSSTGVDSWDNESAKQAVRNYIQEGAMQGAGSVSISTQLDRAQARREQLADRAEERRFQAALYGMTQDEKGNWVYDHTNPGPKSKIKVSDTVATGVKDSNVSIGPYSSELKGNICKASDGSYVLKTGKDSYVYIGNQEAAAQIYEQEENKLNLLATYPIYLAGDNHTEVGKNVGEDWDYWDEEEVTYDALTESVQKAIRQQLLGLGIPAEAIDDLTILKDQEWVGKNRYKVFYDPDKKRTKAKMVEPQEVLDGSGD